MVKRTPWDTNLKLLFNEASSALVLWLYRSAEFVQLASTELEGETIFTDILCEIRIKQQKAMLHIEFQKRRDSTMAQRLWEYNVRATLKYKCPVWSCVIYLAKDSVVEASYCKALPDGQPVHRFDFGLIKMWEIPTQDLLNLGLSDLAPLLPLTREGRQREVIEQAIELLDPHDGERKGELLTLTYGLASLVLTDNADQDWLVWRFGMLFDILKETRAFQELAKEGHMRGLEEGRQKGLQEGRQEGLQEGRQEGQKGLRQAILEVAEARFGSQVLTEAVRVQLERISDLETLRHLVVKVALLASPDELASLLVQEVALLPTKKPGRSERSRKKSTLE